MPTIHQSITIDFETVAAGTDEDREVAWPFEGKWVIEEAIFAPATASVADCSDYATVSLEVNDGAAGSYVTVASFDTSVTGLAVGTKRALALVSTAAAAAAREIQEGYLLRAGKTESGCGVVLDGAMSIRARRIA